MKFSILAALVMIFEMWDENKIFELKKLSTNLYMSKWWDLTKFSSV